MFNTHICIQSETFIFHLIHKYYIEFLNMSVFMKITCYGNHFFKCKIWEVKCSFNTPPPVQGMKIKELPSTQNRIPMATYMAWNSLTPPKTSIVDFRFRMSLWMRPTVLRNDCQRWGIYSRCEWSFDRLIFPRYLQVFIGFKS